MFMLDIETSGLDKEKDDILELTFVHMTKDDKGLYKPGEELTLTFPSEKTPSEWAAKHPAQVDLHKRSNALWDSMQPEEKTPQFTSHHARQMTLEFFKKCGYEGKRPMVCGLNVGNFDLDFLIRKGFIEEKDYGYRLYDLTSVVEHWADVMGFPSEQRTSFIDELQVEGATRTSLPEGSAHGSRWDCHRQIQMLNGSLILARHAMELLVGSQGLKLST
jgi:oligoribonuclease (3'-5' exoribonuclease)